MKGAPTWWEQLRDNFQAIPMRMPFRAPCGCSVQKTVDSSMLSKYHSYHYFEIVKSCGRHRGKHRKLWCNQYSVDQFAMLLEQSFG